MKIVISIVIILHGGMVIQIKVKWIHCIYVRFREVSGLSSFKNFLNQITGCGDIAYCLVGYFILSHPVH